MTAPGRLIYDQMDSLGNRVKVRDVKEGLLISIEEDNATRSVMGFADRRDLVRALRDAGVMKDPWWWRALEWLAKGQSEVPYPPMM